MLSEITKLVNAGEKFQIYSTKKPLLYQKSLNLLINLNNFTLYYNFTKYFEPLWVHYFTQVFESKFFAV
jgi:hypothetical protein